eukprot:TRINITY_DN4936_c0_g2_i2.p1 TRINITY_DN4936_c0_g2~~TRINITY_DN4936_c0_g2_i2.p1  ORF type:complete len:220 (-),score=73.09 TRINITY_DN4936_c0_g2_i2:31-690(-)
MEAANDGPDEFTQAVEIVRSFEQLGQIARSMVVGGLNEIRGEDILSGEGGERKSGGGGGSSGGKAPKETLKPQVETYAPSGELTVTVKSQSSFLSSFPATLVLTNISTSNYWLSESGRITNEWISFNLGSKQKVTKIALLGSPSYNINPKNITVQIPKDKDGNDWKDFCKLEMANGQTTNGWQVFTGFTLNTNLIRLFFHERHGTSGGDYFLVCGVRFY